MYIDTEGAKITENSCFVFALLAILLKCTIHTKALAMGFT